MTQEGKNRLKSIAEFFWYDSRQNIFQTVVVMGLVIALLLQTVSLAYAATFTPGMAKRNAPGPFAAGVMSQGKYDNSGYSDAITFSRGSEIASNFYGNWDQTQGTVAFWITPEWNGNDNKDHHMIYGFNSGNTLAIHKTTDNRLKAIFYNYGGDGISGPDVSNWVAGNTYLVVVSWDNDNSFYNSFNVRFSVDDVHTFGGWMPITDIVPAINFTVGTAHNVTEAADAIIEGLTVYRRPLYDGQYGIDVGNGDEIAQIYNSGAGKDPTLVTGSWDVVFALPTNSSPGALTTGTGNAWSHPHSSNLLYSNTTNTGGFMMNGTYGTDGWSPIGALSPINGTGTSLSFAGQTDYAGGDNYVKLFGNGTTTIPENSGLTVSAWVKLKLKSHLPLGISRDQYIVGLYNMDDSAAFDLVISGSAANDGKIFINQFNGTTFESVIPGILTTIWNSWHHVIGMRDPSTGTGRVYIDGVEVAEGSLSVFPELIFNEVYFDIGKIWYYGDRYAWGEMTDIRYYNRALSENEINSTMYKSTLSPDEMEGLVGWWKMNEASGQAVNDSSGNNNNGTLGADANAASDDPTWSTDTPTPSISALATNEKIFAGGYKYTSSGANQGISRNFTATSGGDYVLRALGHSDGTCSPQVKITRADGTTEISHLNGSTSSTRTDPDVYVFTWESPAAEANQVQLLNTATGGTCYWHQVEVLPNLIDNPSMESGSGDPWIPDGYYSAGMEAGDTDQEVAITHSGSSSLNINSGVDSKNISQIRVNQSGQYYGVGAFAYGTGTQTTYLRSMGLYMPGQSTLTDSTTNQILNRTGAWIPSNSVRRSNVTGDVLWTLRGVSGTGNSYIDDLWMVNLSDVSLTVTPASLANSTEATGVRVDGADKYTESITGWTATNGFVSFDFTPRHSSANMLKFLPSSDPQLFNAVFDSSNYINLVAVSDNVFRFRVRMGGTDYQTTWNHTGEFTAGTTYSIKLRYDGTSATVYLDDVAKASVTPVGGINWSGNVPNVFNFGSDGGTQVIDATFGNIVFDSTAPIIAINALDPDPTSDTTPTLTGTTTEAIGTVASVEQQVDDTGGAWSACTADDGTFDEASEAFSCTPPTLSDGSHAIYVRATDSNGNTTTGGSESSDAFVVDATSPSVPGTPATTSPTADTTPTWSFTASTDVTAGLADPAYIVEWSQDSTFADGVSSATTNTNSFTHSTPLGDATWYVRVRATDAAGNQSAWSDSGSVQINTGAPTGNVSINGGSGFTNSRNVTLTLTASSGFFSGTSDIDMKLSNLSDLSDGVWEAFAASKSWTLAEDDGVKTVYVQFKDATDNTSGAFMDSITLDTSSPMAATLLLPSHHSYTRDERPVFQFRPNSDSDIRHYHLLVYTPTGSFRINDIAANGSGSTSRDEYTVSYLHFDDQDTSNNLIQVTTRSDVSWPREAIDGRLLPGVNQWQVVAVDQANNETIGSNTVFVDRSGPNVNLTQLNTTPLTTNQLVTSDTTPTVFGVVTDLLSGDNPQKKSQTSSGPLVASGPRQVEVAVSKRVGTIYQLEGTFIIQLTQTQFSCNSKVITNHQEQECNKQSSFEFTPREPLTSGLYQLKITGTDQVGNLGSGQDLWLEVTDYQQLVTDEQKAIINKELAALPTSEIDKYKEGIDITTPQDKDLTVDKLLEEVSTLTDVTINTLTQPPARFLDRLGQRLIAISRNTTTSLGQSAGVVGQWGSGMGQAIQGTSHQLTTVLTQLRENVVWQPLQQIISNVINSQQQVTINLEQARSQLQEQLAKAVFSASRGMGEVSESLGRSLIHLGYQLATQPTQISQVEAELISPTLVTIRWTTNHPATGKVNWGNAPGQYQYELQTTDRTTAHEFTLENLNPNTTYHFEVMSQNKTYVYDANRTFVTPSE